MSKLLDLARSLLPERYEERSAADSSEIEHRFVEELTFADPDEIVAMLHTVMAEDWMGLPVWARNLAFRLALLQRPDDRELRREAAADLRCFGPDWDHIADALYPQVDS